MYSASATLTTATFSNQLEAGLARFKKFGLEVIVLASLDNKDSVTCLYTVEVFSN
jgi:hypothetical protein